MNELTTVEIYIVCMQFVALMFLSAALASLLTDAIVPRVIKMIMKVARKKR